MAIGNVLMLWNARVPMAQGYGDFVNFYSSGVLVHRGLGSELYNSAAQWKVQQEFSFEVMLRRGPMRFLRPPFEALFFSVFATWPYPKALLLWTCFKLALLAAIPFVVVRGRLWREGFPLWATVFLVLGTFPAFIDLLMGQDALLLAFLFAVSFWQLDMGRDMGAGFTLGLALFKFQFVIPFVVTLWIAGRKRVLPGFAMSASVLLAISSVVVGWRELLRYPGYLLDLNRATGVGISPDLQVTIRGLLTLFVGRLSYPGRIHWALVPVALGAVVYAGLIWRKAGQRYLAEGFGLAAIVAIVTSYYAYSYDLLLLIVPLLAVRTRPDDALNEDKLTRYLESSGLLLLLLTPAYWFVKMQFHAECLMALPLLAVGVALARRLRYAAADQQTAIPDGPR
jgi:Glycosyltransferase family 87